MKDAIEEKEKVRNAEIEGKLKEVAKLTEKKEKQKMIDRLSLPAIKYFSKENKSTQSTNDLKKVVNSPKAEGTNGLGLKQKSYSLPKKIPPKALDLKHIESPRRSQKQVTTVEPAEDRNERIFK